jgi:hypothetical protein
VCASVPGVHLTKAKQGDITKQEGSVTMIGERRCHQVRRFSIPLSFYLSIHRHPYPPSCKIPDVSYPRSRHLPPPRVKVDTDQNGKRLSSKKRKKKKNKVGAAFGHRVSISGRIPLLNLDPFSPSLLHFSPHRPFLAGELSNPRNARSLAGLPLQGPSSGGASRPTTAIHSRR